ncbi:MAG: extracellular solute-binding protein [Chloroflexi bacterium]|nr:extracellular solute-binding protein [Chloroflexota bacterium]
MELVAQITAGDALAIAAVRSLFVELAPALAVRSSAVGEDSEAASFAGQHVSVLNVMTADAMMLAIQQVHDSALTPAVLAYSTKTYPDEVSQPKTWADVYDVDRIPGRRSFSQVFWNDSVMSALLADNPELLNTPEGRASLGKLTQEQIDRGYEILEEFKSNVTRWWVAGSECPQLLISGEVDMCMAWNGRIFDAQQAGAPMAICWECGHFMQTESFSIPNGLKELDSETFELAQLFIAWTSFPEQNARIAQFISYGPINQDSLPFLGEPVYDAVRNDLPSSAVNLEYAIPVDSRWLGDVANVQEERFQEFLQQ